MEAVIASGGKQYRVTPGQVISVEKLSVDPGEPVEFRSVLLVTRDGGEVVVGADVLKSARVSREEFRAVLRARAQLAWSARTPGRNGTSARGGSPRDRLGGLRGVRRT